MSIRGAVCVLLAMTAIGCSGPDTPQLARDALEAMGGADAVRGVQNFVMKSGSGTRSRLGQAVKSGDPDQPGRLDHVMETIDLAGRRAALDYELTTESGFTQHRQEILTKRGGRGVGLENVAGRPLAVMSPSGLFSWGTQNSPVMALERNVITVALAAADAQPATHIEDKMLEGRPYRFGSVTTNGETLGVYFDPDTKLIAAFETLDTETMLGDVPAIYRLEDYRDVSGVKLPHKITIRKGGTHYADVQFTAAAINDAGSQKVFSIPDTVSAEVDRAIAAGTDYSPVRLTRVADGVYFAQAYSHHSLIVEFPAFLAVVEAPYTEAQTKTLATLVSEQFPGKPIRYAAVTHPHFDHAGGVRAMAAQGATIVAARAHESAFRMLLNAPHTNPADDLATKRAASQPTGTLDTFEDKKIISDGGQSLELYAIAGSPHVDPMVIAYVPSSRVLFQSDLFFPGTGGGTTPEAAHLLQAVRKLKLRVDTNAGGHGGVAPFQELIRAAGGASTNG